MHEPDAGPRHRAVDLLEHFVPERVLRELRERALSFQREEQFRAYVLKRAWFLMPLLLVFVVVDTAIAAEMVFLARAAGPSPRPPGSWSRSIASRPRRGSRASSPSFTGCSRGWSGAH